MRKKLGWTVAIACLGAAVSGCAGGGGGTAELSCAVASDGLLSNCIVLSQTPPDQGVGATAARSAEGSRVSGRALLNPPASGRIDFVVRNVKTGS